MLAKLTSKNQLTLPKSVTDKLGPVQYFEVQLQAGQVLLTPVRIQRGDAVRVKLGELALGDEADVQAVAFASKAAKTSQARKTAAPAKSKTKAKARVVSTSAAKAPRKVTRKSA